MKTDVAWLNGPIENTETCCATDETDNANELDESVPKRRRLTVSTSDYCDSFVDDIWELVADQRQWQPYADYISDCRININVRQVLEAGAQTL